MQLKPELCSKVENTWTLTCIAHKTTMNVYTSTVENLTNSNDAVNLQLMSYFYQWAPM